MALVLKPAVKDTKALKVLIYGPTWSGKTYGALLMATGLIKAMHGYKDIKDSYKHILLSDSEYGRGTQYAHMGPYNYVLQEAPYLTEDLLQTISDVEKEKQIDVLIVDSFTHYWSKDGGILEQKSAKDKLGGNTYANWQDYTAKFNKVVSAILSSSKVIIATARAKSDTLLIKDDTTGRTNVKTVGLKPELRDDIDFEFDVVLNIDKDTHGIVVVKGLPGMAPYYEPITAEWGEWLYQYATSPGVTAEREKIDVINTITAAVKRYDLLQFVQVRNSGRKLVDMSLEEVLACEADVLKEVKRLQVDKNKRKK